MSLVNGSTVSAQDAAEQFVVLSEFQVWADAAGPEVFQELSRRYNATGRSHVFDLYPRYESFVWDAARMRQWVDEAKSLGCFNLFCLGDDIRTADGHLFDDRGVNPALRNVLFETIAYAHEQGFLVGVEPTHLPPLRTREAFGPWLRSWLGEEVPVQCRVDVIKLSLEWFGGWLANPEISVEVEAFFEAVRDVSPGTLVYLDSIGGDWREPQPFHRWLLGRYPGTILSHYLSTEQIPAFRAIGARNLMVQINPSETFEEAGQFFIYHDLTVRQLKDVVDQRLRFVSLGGVNWGYDRKNYDLFLDLLRPHVNLARSLEEVRAALDLEPPPDPADHGEVAAALVALARERAEEKIRGEPAAPTNDAGRPAWFGESPDGWILGLGRLADGRSGAKFEGAYSDPIRRRPVQATFGIDLGRPTEVRRISLVPCLSERGPEYVASQLRVEYLADGQWQAIPGGEWGDNRERKLVVDLPQPLVLEAIRVVVINQSDDGKGNYRACCQELAIEGPPPTAGQSVAATEARVDIIAEGAEIDRAFLTPPAGTITPMNWVPPSERGGTLTVQVPIVHFADTEFEIRLTVRDDCTLKIDLMGPWEPGERGSLRESTVEWIRATAAGRPLEGFEPGTAWHNRRVVCRAAARQGDEMVLALSARVPENLRRPPAPRPEREPPAFELARQFRRGVNLSNFLEVPPGEDWGDNTPRIGDYQQIAAEGFDHVRIPIGWHHGCGPAPDYVLDERWAQRVDEQVDLAQNVGLAVIINVHHFHQFTEAPDEFREQLLAIWRQVASRYRNRPATVALEILNEPNGRATTELMSDFLAAVIPEIREIDPERALFVGPGHWNQAAELGRLSLPADERLIVTVHTYTPHPFTHQGAGWSGENRLVRGIVFPGPPAEPLPIPRGISEPLGEWLRRYNELPGDSNPTSAAAVACELRQAAAWGRYEHRPVHVGEFGAYTKADDESRARYLEVVRRECEALEIGWCLWDWKAGFNYWDPARRQPMPGLRRALFGDGSPRKE